MIHTDILVKIRLAFKTPLAIIIFFLNTHSAINFINICKKITQSKCLIFKKKIGFNHQNKW